MKGKMLRVIYCVLSNLTVILFETTVLWLHPGEGMAGINGAGAAEIYGGAKPGAADACPPPSPPPDAEQGKICSRGCTWSPSPPLRRCLLTYKFSLSRSSLDRGSAAVALPSPHRCPCPAPPPGRGKWLLPLGGRGTGALRAYCGWISHRHCSPAFLSLIYCE